MGSRHTLAAALVSMLASLMFVVNTAADQTSSSAALTAADNPVIVVTMLPAGQRQALAVAPLVAQVLRCAAQQQQQPQAAPVTAGSKSAEVGGTPGQLRTALSSAADTLNRALTGGASF